MLTSITISSAQATSELPIFRILDKVLLIDNSPCEDWLEMQVWAIEYGQDKQFYYGVRPISSNQPLQFLSKEEICLPEEARKISSDMHFQPIDRIKLIESIGWNEPALNL